MYAAAHLSLFEQWCRARNPSNYNPYPAAFDRVDGIPYQGLILCGGNPLLSAKYVEDLRVVEDGDGNETLHYVYRGEPRALYPLQRETNGCFNYRQSRARTDSRQ